ncbi:MAG: DUF4331 domain-containing protein [Chitinophagaceae bacterium]|nr:DUF4331 domain-containing protein [Chitinophagaceae bacterium]
MKIRTGLFSLLAAGSLLFTACNKENTPPNRQVYEQQDQMARPAINTVFVGTADKDMFNTTIPSSMGAAFQAKFKTRLLALNAGYTTNALGQNADQLTGLLATDVLNVSKTAPTTFFDGTNILTGRALADDVIDVELLLLFGGPTGTSNPGLTSDNATPH